ncbi:SymE family type I addiction module toxin [Paraburkholderia xenovorans]
MTSGSFDTLPFRSVVSRLIPGQQVRRLAYNIAARHIRFQPRKPKSGRDWRTPTFFPWLRIAGMWLEHAGFPPGQRVRIEVQYGRLVITPD